MCTRPLSFVFACAVANRMLLPPILTRPASFVFPTTVVGLSDWGRMTSALTGAALMMEDMGFNSCGNVATTAIIGTTPNAKLSLCK